MGGFLFSLSHLPVRNSIARQENFPQTKKRYAALHHLYPEGTQQGSCLLCKWFFGDQPSTKGPTREVKPEVGRLLCNLRTPDAPTSCRLGTVEARSPLKVKGPISSEKIGPSLHWGKRNLASA